MTISTPPAAPDACRPVFDCGIGAYGVVEATLASLPGLRENPGGPPSRPIPPRFLRHSDEQTVVGLAAVLQAIEEHDLESQCFDEWGVLAAPHFPGRIVGAATLAQFREAGPPAITPHIIPQHSLHSASSAISIALGMHGPSFGIGGGPEAVVEAISVALTFWDRTSLPGVWLVLTQWDPEPVPDGLGSSTVESVCRGVALALVPGHGQTHSLRLTTSTATGSSDAVGEESNGAPEAVLPNLTALAIGLAAGPGLGRTVCWSCRLPWGGQIELIAADHNRQVKAARG